MKGLSKAIIVYDLWQSTNNKKFHSSVRQGKD